MSKDIQHYLQQKCLLIDRQLEIWIAEKEVPYRELFQAARYSLHSGGKRLRPILTLAASEAFLAPQEHALTPACAVEMIHTYSLIHDDLPCMDNDDFRRGKPTLHKKYNEGHAVLTGDFLLTLAFGMISKEKNLNANQKVKIIEILADRSGAEGMIGGQVMDISSCGKKLEMNFLQQMHLYKTAALISASLEIAGIVANIPQQELSLFRTFGEKIGLAFQIIDDVLDVTASEQKHGKTTSTDILNDKTTYVTLLGIEESQNHAHKLFQEAVDLVKPLPYNCHTLFALAEHLIKRKV